MTYCIYLDQVIPFEETNEEHIIPLSLGGRKDFVLRVGREINAKLGSKLDGEMCKDPIIEMARSKLRTKGHSRKSPKMIWKKSNIGDDRLRPVQITFPTDLTEPIRVYDPKLREYIESTLQENQLFESQMKIDATVYTRFTAKVGLAAGYFLYGDAFRSAADHNALRKIMGLEINSNVADIESLDVRGLNPYKHVDDENKGHHEILRLLSSVHGLSTIIFVHNIDRYACPQKLDQ